MCKTKVLFVISKIVGVGLVSLILAGNSKAGLNEKPFARGSCEFLESSGRISCDYQYDQSLQVKSMSLKVGNRDVQIPEDGLTKYPGALQKTAILFMVDVSDPARRLTVEDKNVKNILELISTKKPHQEIGVASFDSNFELLTPISDDVPKIAASVMSLKAKGQATEFYKGVLAGIDVLSKTTASRKVLVLLSDGKDEDRAYKLEDAVNAANKAHIQILSLGYSERPSDTPYLQTLKKLADETHGVYIDLSSGRYPTKFLDSPFEFAENGGLVSFEADRFHSEQLVTLGLVSDDKKLAEINIDVVFPDRRNIAIKIFDFVVEKWYFIVSVLFILTGFIYFAKKRKKDAPVVYAVIDAMDGSGSTYELSRDAVRIGRSNDNEIVLANDSISTHHAEIQRRREGDVYIVDLASTNGIYVNDEKVTKAPLKSGDLIELGEVRLRFNLNSD